MMTHKLQQIQHYNHQSVFLNCIMQQGQYESENSQLRLMFLERQKRLAQIQEPQAQNTIAKQILKVDQQAQFKSSSNTKIRMNSIIYDKRPTHLKRNKITLSSLLHEDVDVFHREPYSANVQCVMIATYGFETEVFLPILTKGLPIFIFNRHADEKNGEVLRKYSGFQNLVVISPPKSNTGYGVFHTKLWLVKFKTFLRVVVGTGNNHYLDWTVWQNAYWYHDCPLLPIQKSNQQPSQHQPQNQSGWGQIKDFDYEKDFLQTLKRVVAEMNPKSFDVLQEMKVNLESYSFASVRVVLIPSFPGRFKAQEMQQVGLCKVRKIMRLHKKRFKQATVTCNCTSLGKMDEKMVREVYFAFSPWVNQFSIKNFKLVYPTQAYINNQTCGEAGVLFLTRQNYEKCELKKEIFYRYEQSAENGVTGGIPHLKTIIVEEEGESDKCVFYLGSHNLTRAAWGTYQKNQTQIYCSNSQLGLLFVDYSKTELKYWLPYKWPPSKYTAEDVAYVRTFDQS